MPRPRGPRQPTTEGWFHSLKEDRTEIFLKLLDADGQTALKIRATGPDSEMGELLDWFERATGLTVTVPETYWRRFKRGPQATPNQSSLFGEGMPQLSSQDATVGDNG